MKWITAHQLEQWADRPISSLELPGIVSDLIRASVPDISAIRFPSGDKGQIRGFDGFLDCNSEVLNVPDGPSIWEFGTNKDYKAKATSDFDKRSQEISIENRAETTFVFVTPRTWDSSRNDNKIEDWVQGAIDKGYGWKNVRCIDGVQLETWLQSCPAVSAWHARKTIKCTSPSGVYSTDEFWETFVSRFNPLLNEEVLLCEREKEIELLISSLMNNSGLISFSADTEDEVIAFAIAAIRKSEPITRLFLESRTLIIDDLDAGRELLNESNLIYFLRGKTTTTPPLFSKKAPTLLPLSRYQKRGDAQTLTRPSGQAMGQAIAKMGFPENEAIALARGCGRSLSALARQIPSGNYELPGWLNSHPILLPVIFAGAWDSQNELDKSAILQLSEKENYFRYEGQLRPFTSMEDALLESEGTIWKVKAPIDAFIHINHLIGPEHLELLRPIITSVFSQLEEEIDPNTPIDFSYTKTNVYSRWLKDGLATTLLHIAVLGKDMEFLSNGSNVGQRFVDELIQSLPGLTENHRLLASLKDQLPVLAEAAPIPFLTALEHMLEGDARAIRPIFDAVKERNQLYPSHCHTGLLWALEALAWAPNYFSRAVIILARLAVIDPGGNLGNRPINSLREIFLSWNPNTNAPESQRLTALDQIANLDINVAWNLIIKLMPSFHDSSSPTQKPILRDIGMQTRKSITYQQLWNYQSAIIDIAITLAGNDIERWKKLIPIIHLFPKQEDYQKAVTALDYVFNTISQGGKEELWLQIKEEVNRHEKFQSAEWSLNHEQLTPLKDLLNRHQPTDPYTHISVLFDDIYCFGDRKQEELAEIQRIEAVKQLYVGHGVESLFTLYEKIKQPSLLINIIIKIDIPKEAIEELIIRGVSQKPISPLTLEMISLYRSMIGHQEAILWLKLSSSAHNWNSEIIAKILLCWPGQTTTWHAVKTMGNEVEKIYWSTKSPVWTSGSKQEFFRMVIYFLKYDRAYAALQSTSNRLSELPTKLIFRILKNLIIELNKLTAISDSMLSYYITKVFEELDIRDNASIQDIAEFEYAYFSIIQYEKDRELCLHKLMASNPNFYHDILCQVFIGDNELKTELSETERNNWRRNYKLLTSFKQVPGQTADGFDIERLSTWIKRVLELGELTERKSITEQYIGHILAHSILDNDGGWPHQVIREQIESIQSFHVETGIMSELYNSRGVFTRGLYEGGKQERSLAERYNIYAEIAVAWPRTSAMLKAIAQNWEEEAKRQDLEAEQRKMRS